MARPSETVRITFREYPDFRYVPLQKQMAVYEVRGWEIMSVEALGASTWVVEFRRWML